MQGSNGVDGQSHIRVRGRRCWERGTKAAEIVCGFLVSLEGVEQSSSLSLQLRAIGALRDRLVEREDLKTIYQRPVRSLLSYAVIP